jgi:hypothetical protein
VPDPELLVPEPELLLLEFVVPVVESSEHAASAASDMPRITTVWKSFEVAGFGMLPVHHERSLGRNPLAIHSLETVVRFLENVRASRPRRP